MVKSFEELESVLANNGEVLTSIWKFKPRISVDQEKQEVIIYFGEDFVMDENIQNFRRELNGKFRPAYTSSKGEEFGQCFVFDNEVFARAFTGEDIADIKEGAIWSVKYSNFTESAIESESEISQEDVEPVQQNIIEEDIPESYEHRPINEIVPNEDEINSLKRRLGIGPYSDGDVTIISTAYLNEYAKSKGIRLFSFSERENEILRYCVKNFSEGITGLNRNNGAVKDILNSYFQTSLVNCPNYYTKKYNCLAQKYSQDYELAKDTIDGLWKELCDSVNGRNNSVTSDAYSKNTSYYTPNEITSALSEIVKSAGLQQGQKFGDFAVGMGAFIKDYDDKNLDIVGVDIDPLASLTTKILYPNANIINSPLQDVKLNKDFDVTATNVPFSGNTLNVIDLSWKYKSSAQKMAKNSLHNYYIMKMLEQTKEGGMSMIITSTGFLDNSRNDVRKEIANQAKLIGVVRLPAGVFADSEQTECDVLIFRKWKKGEEKIQKFEFVNSSDVSIIEKATGKNKKGEDTDTYNTRYVNNIFRETYQNVADEKKVEAESDSLILGDLFIGTRGMGKFVKKDFFVSHPSESKILSLDEIKDLSAKMKSTLLKQIEVEGEFLSVIPEQDIEEEQTIKTTFNKNVVIIEEDGIKIPYVEYFSYNTYGEQSSSLEKIEGLSDKQISTLSDYIDLRDAYKNHRKIAKETANSQVSDEFDKSLVYIRNVYENFVKKNGNLFDNKDISFIKNLDKDFLDIILLEKRNEEGKIEVADILERNIFVNSKHKLPNTIEEHVLYSMNKKFGEIDIAYLEEQFGDNWQQVCKGEVFFCPEEEKFIPKNIYLSGNLADKINYIETLGLANKYADNLSALKEAMPKRLTIDEIDIRGGMPYITKEIYVSFCQALNDTVCKHNWSYKFQYNANLGIIECVAVFERNKSNDLDAVLINLGISQANNMPFGSDANVGDKLKRLNDAFTSFAHCSVATFGTRQKKDESYDDYNIRKGQWEYEAKHIFEILNNELKTFIKQSPEYTAVIEKAYNDSLNSYVVPKFDGSFIEVEGLRKDLYDYQRRAVAQMLYNRTGLLDHAVGAGKTLTMASLMKTMKKMNMCNRPVMVVRPNNIASIKKDLESSFTDTKIVYVMSNDGINKNIASSLNRIKNEDFDLCVMSSSALDNIYVPSAEIVETKREIAYQTEIMDAILSDKQSSAKYESTLNDIKKKISKLQENLKGLENKEAEEQKKKVGISELGFDFFCIDEAHEFKNLATETGKKMVQGSGVADSSGKAKNMMSLCHYIHSLNNNTDTGVVMATGTPITNAITEMLVYFKYMKPNFLQKAGWDDKSFEDTFYPPTEEITYDAIGTPKRQFVYGKVSNINALSPMYMTLANVVDTENTPQLLKNRPKGNVEQIMIPSSSAYYAITEDIKLILEYQKDMSANRIPKVKLEDLKYIKLTDGEKKALSLTAISVARRGTVDVDFVIPREILERIANDYNIPMSLLTRNSKREMCVKMIKERYDETVGIVDGKQYKGVQLIFCDQVGNARYEKKEIIYNSLWKEHSNFLAMDFELKSMYDGLKKKSKEESDEYVFLKNDELNNHIDKMIEHIQNNYNLEEEILGGEAREIIVQLERAKDDTSLHHKWSFYDELKQDLIKAGVPANEIVFFNQSTYGNDNKKKEKLINDINSAKYRVVIGSSESMGVGNNLQESVVGGILLDAPWKASDDEQRLGRMLRQGNKIPRELLDKWGGVKAYRFTQENSNDVFMYDKIIRKGNMIRSIKNGTMIEREADFASKGLASDANGELSVSAEECMANLNSNFNLEIKQTLNEKIIRLETEQIHLRNQASDREKKLVTKQKTYELNSEILTDLTANGDYLREHCSFYNSKIGDEIYENRLTKAKALFGENAVVRKDSVYLNIDGIEYSSVKEIAKAIRSYEHSNKKSVIKAFGIEGTIEGKGSDNRFYMSLRSQYLKDILINDRVVKEGEPKQLDFGEHEPINILEKEIDFSMTDDKLAHFFGDLIKYQLLQEARYNSANYSLKGELEVLQNQKVDIFDKGDILSSLKKKMDECESIIAEGRKIYSRSQATEFKEMIEELMATDKEQRGVLVSEVNNVKFKTISVAQTSSQFLSLENDILLTLLIGDSEKASLLAPLHRDADINGKEEAYNKLEAVTSQCKKLSENKEELSLDRLNPVIFEYKILDKYNKDCGKFYPYRYVSNSDGDFLIGVLIADGKSEQKTYDCRKIQDLSPNIEYAINVANGTEIKYIEDELLTQGVITQEEYNNLQNGLGISNKLIGYQSNDIEELPTKDVGFIDLDDTQVIEVQSESMVADDIKHENDNMEIDKYKFPYSNIVEKSEIQMWKDRFSQIGVPGASYSLEEDMALAKRFMTPSQYAVAIERDMMENFTSVAKGAREAFRNYFEGVSIDQEPSFSIYASKDVSVLSWDGEDFIRGVNQNGDWTGYSAEETFSLKEINPLGIREMLQESADFSQSVNNDVVVNELKSLSETIIDKYKRGEISNTELIETRNMYQEGGEEIVSLVCEQMTIDASRKESVEEIIDNLNSIISPADELIWHKLNGGLDDNTLIVISSCFNEAEIDILSEQLRDMKLIESKSNLKMSDESALQQIIEQGKILGETIVYKQLLDEPTVGKQFESVVLDYLNDEEKRQIIISALDEYSSEKFIREDKSVDYEGSIGLIKETMQKIDDSIKMVDYDVLPENIRNKRIDMDIQSLTVVNDIVCEYHKVKMLRCDYEKINRSFEIAESKYQNPVLAKNPVFQQIYEKAKIDKDNKIADINATVSSMKYFNQEKLDQNISEEQSESQSRGMRR